MSRALTNIVHIRRKKLTSCARFDFDFGVKCMKRIIDLKNALSLESHPEGGAFCETYRASMRVGLLGERERFLPSSTAIYYLLESGECSVMHRIPHDEVWHFYEGDALRVTMINPLDGVCSSFVLGRDLALGQRYQAVVPAGYWFGARLEAGGHFALTGCTVAPGFVFEDFELARRDMLLAQFPQHRDVILSLTHASA